MWQFTGKKRPSFALAPGEGQESVWDYPRPPMCQPDTRNVIVRHRDQVIVDTNQCTRVLETASPPTFYIPLQSVNTGVLIRSPGSSFCEWKGAATYWSFDDGQTQIKNVGWSYEEPSDAFRQIAGYLSFYPAKVECTVDGETVRPQPGGFYGGWVTDEVVGPYKGEPGTNVW